MNLRLVSHSIIAVFLLVGSDIAYGQISTSGNPALIDQPVTLMATVKAPSGVTAIPTGSMSFSDGTVALGTVDLVGGMAQITAIFSSLGDHSLVARYSGDTVFSSTVSAPVTETIIANVGFTMSVQPVIIAQLAGEQSTGTVTLFADQFAISHEVDLHCEGLPPGVSCQFDAQGVLPTSSGQHVKLTIVSSAAQQVAAASGFAALSAFMAVPLLSLASRKMCLIALALVVMTAGCRTTFKQFQAPTPAGTYSLQVVATDQTVTRTTAVQLVVQ
jgi:hypothetical protein